ncbi:MAG: glucosylceramidase [Bacteroidia bacterium]|nr:glucosylceramidase [Bacteroidia bacterium]
MRSIRVGAVLAMLALSFFVCIPCLVLAKSIDGIGIVTSPSTSKFLVTEKLVFTNQTISNANPIISINPSITFQTIDGFGNCLTGGSAALLSHMDAKLRHALLTELFAFDQNNIGISYLRISIGASDLDDRVFSYDDMPQGETDPQLTHFSLAPDQTALIPILKEILSINPKIKLMSSPWSAPVWMKTNQNSKGGSLKAEYYDVYAKYFVKYIQAMQKEGIAIDAITIQNEPLHPGNNPSMYMTATDQAEFIKRSLGPAFEKEKVKTKIIVYDHNADHPDYPITIFKDPEASKYVDGSAFHLYAGPISALSSVHEAYPTKNLYFTEQWVGAPGNMTGDLAWHVRTLIIGGTRNWCRTVLEWNLASDPKYNPHTPGGCTECLGAITIDGDHITRNPAYYIIAHAAKFVCPGSVRIESNDSDLIPNVAFKTPEGKTVLIVQNNSGVKQAFNIRCSEKSASVILDKDGVGTYIW